MALDGTKFTIGNGGLGVAKATGTNIVLVAGVCSNADAPLSVQPFSDPDDIYATYTSGPLARCAANVLYGGAVSVLCVKVDEDANEGSASAVTAGSGNAGGGTLTIDGSTEPVDDFSVTVLITEACTALGTDGKFKLSFNEGRSYGPVHKIPLSGSYLVTEPGTFATGITLVFAEGITATHFDVGDSFTFTTTAARADVTAWEDALAIALEYKAYSYEGIYIAGSPAEADGAVVTTLWSTLSSILSDWEAANKFRWWMAENARLPVGSNAWLHSTTDLVSFKDKMIEACDGVGGDPRGFISNFTGRYVDRYLGREVYGNIGPFVISLISQKPVYQSLGEPDECQMSPLVVAITNYSDAQIIEMTNMGAICGCVRDGKSGFYVYYGRSLDADGSDFMFMRARRVMDKVCTLVNNRATGKVQHYHVIDTETGNVSTAAISFMQTYLEKDVVEMARGETPEISKAEHYVFIKPNQNLIATRTFLCRIGVTPLGYSDNIWFSASFQNPFRQTS